MSIIKYGFVIFLMNGKIPPASKVATPTGVEHAALKVSGGQFHIFPLSFT